MNANDRNKEMYGFMMSFENNPYETETLIKDIQKGREIFSKDAEAENIIRDFKEIKKGLDKFALTQRLLVLKYIEILSYPDTEGKKEFVAITHEGWQFCESYEQYKERKES